MSHPAPKPSPMISPDENPQMTTLCVSVSETRIGHDKAVSTVSLFLRGAETHSELERSNYSACIYFEKHAGAVIYSSLRHILE